MAGVSAKGGPAGNQLGSRFPGIGRGPDDAFGAPWRRSPAFIVYPPDRVQGEMVLTSENPIVLLGLVHGHYYIDQDVAFTGDIFYGSGKVPVNAGMAVVVPAQKIIDTLMLPELVEKRERLLGEIRKHGSVPRADSDIV